MASSIRRVHRASGSLGLAGLLMVATVGTGGLAGCAPESCSGAADAPGPTHELGWNPAQGTVHEAHGVSIGLMSTSCQDGRPRASLSLGSDGVATASEIVHPGDTIEYAGIRIFVKSVSRLASGSGDVRLHRLED